jgi:hypothetical protein
MDEAAVLGRVTEVGVAQVDSSICFKIDDGLCTMRRPIVGKPDQRREINRSEQGVEEIARVRISDKSAGTGRASVGRMRNMQKQAQRQSTQDL